MKHYRTTYDGATGMLYTALSGIAQPAAIRSWQKGLESVLGRLENGTTFKMLIDLQGFKPANLPAQRCFRLVLPQTLARHGWEVGYAQLLGVTFPLSARRGIRCIALAYIHHDAARMTAYRQLYGRHNEQYFSDLPAARTWLQQYPLSYPPLGNG